MQPDEIGFGGLQLMQGSAFRYGVDAILLAAFAAGETGGRGMKGEPKHSSKSDIRICDMGCGNGIVSLVLSHKIPNSIITGVELQTEEATRAAENVKLNHLSGRIRIVESDILNLEVGWKFDVVVTNPPYFRRGGAIPSTSTGKYIARHETTADAEAFIRIASELLTTGGELFMVHRPDRLVDVCVSMRKYHLEPKELQMIIPHPGEPANIMLIHGIKGAGPELKLLPDITVREADGRYSPLINRVYEREEKSF